MALRISSLLHLSGLVALWALGLLLVLPANAEAQSVEYAVKATYLYKFAPFVGWPSGTYDGAAEPFSICVVGHDPFGVIIDDAVRGQQVDGRPIVVRRLPKVQGAGDCQIMYISGHGPQPVREALDAVRGEPILTVTDSASSPNAEGIIHFVIRNNRVRFNVDDQAAGENGLQISARLLELAAKIKSRE